MERCKAPDREIEYDGAICGINCRWIIDTPGNRRRGGVGCSMFRTALDVDENWDPLRCEGCVKWTDGYEKAEKDAVSCITHPVADASSDDVIVCSSATGESEDPAWVEFCNCFSGEHMSEED